MKRTRSLKELNMADALRGGMLWLEQLTIMSEHDDGNGGTEAQGGHARNSVWAAA
ncbi:MAG: hypothetical protein AB7K24_18690 [Gemmataceae bacterium]